MQQAQARQPQAGSPRPAGAAKPGPPAVPPELDANPIWQLGQPALIAILQDPGASMFRKAIACKKLAQIGTRESIAPLAALLGEKRLGHYARFGLEPNPDPAAGDALRAALPKLKGRVLMGVIHSLGVRRDVRSIDALGKLMYDGDAEIAQAASASLGTIGGPQAAKLLRAALSRTKLPVLPVVARAALVCAEGLMASDRAQAIGMYSVLTGPEMPRPVRQAAYRAINAAQRA